MIGAGLALAAAVLSTPPQKVGECAIVRGRLSIWNGTPATRIWIIGTDRVLGVRDEALPPAVDQLWFKAGYGARVAADLYGDFHVCALTPSRAGEMQSVRVIGVYSPVFKPRPAS